jgi:signal transduction histidine kinase
MTRPAGETILVVSPSRESREALSAALRRAGHGVRGAASAAEAIEAIAAEPVAVLVVDGDPPDADVASFVGRAKAAYPDAVAIVLRAAPGVEDTVALMKEGAFHVLERPPRAAELLAVTAKALEHGRLSRGNRELQSRLDLSERLAMIGRLASGVAHELNNPLDGVCRFVRLAHDAVAAAHRESGEYLERALSGLSRMAGIVRQLLTFSRNVVLENETESLRTMLEEVVRTLAPGGSAAPRVELENPYVDVLAPRALFQVFVNLLKNALDAVEAKGARGRVRIVVQRSDEGFEIAFADNGCGIAEENLRRVFEPFFTTKAVGKGTGLGLPISARIVERCGGTIRLESRENEGTTVTVALPNAAPARAAPPLQRTEA